MDSATWKARYEFIKKIAIDYGNNNKCCKIAEYTEQKLDHEGFWISEILAHGRSKKFIDEYRKYMPLSEYDCEPIVDKLCKEEIIFKLTGVRYALNRKFACPVNTCLYPEQEQLYKEKIESEGLMFYFNDLNKLSLEDKLKHRILFSTLRGKVIEELIDKGIYTYYDLVTASRYVAYNWFDKCIQAHLHLLGLEYDMYELKDKIKIDKDKKIQDILEILSKLRDKNKYKWDLKFNYFNDNIFIPKDNNDNYIKWLNEGIQLFGLEQYFEFKIMNFTDFKKNRYSGYNNLMCVYVKNNFPIEDIKTLFKLRGYL